MKKQQKRHRIIATFFLLIFFPTLVPTNLFASNNGPKSPEAASFEPVDATDMVNLITGQYSYVLPLLNVPSPEGGYPLALGYHAGIAMDQEASWTGLGWNVNPGAIDRSINGYADDYADETITEYFYDSSHTESISSVSVAYSNGALSVGLGFNWGNNQSLGGIVSVGYGYKDASGFSVGGNASIGFGSSSGNASVGVGITTTGGLSVGINVNSQGTAGVSVGTSNNNGEGFSVGYDTSGTISAQVHTGGDKKLKRLGTLASIGISISSKGEIGAGMNSIAGSGQSTAFNNTISMGDYNSSSSGWMVPLSVPTPIGVFSLSFGNQKFTYNLSMNKEIGMNGLLNFNRGEMMYIVGVRSPGLPAFNKVFYNENCALAYKDQMTLKYPNLLVGFSSSLLSGVNLGGGDIHEFSLDNSLDIKLNNFVLPNYDNFNVSAQGLSGNFKVGFYESSNTLVGTGRFDSYSVPSGYRVNYTYNIFDNGFHEKPDFYFENEISTYLNTTDVLPVVLDTQTSYPQTITGYFEHDPNYGSRLKRRTSKGIRYWLNGDIVKDNKIKCSGFLNTNSSGFNRTNAPVSGIGAFEVTASDGKTYHYSLPVYNHEIITRRYGMIAGHVAEGEAYMEKRQLQPYATHWLLTGITGPDFVDNGDGVIGDGDLGYYTSFDYGLWSDTFSWNQSNKGEYTDMSNPNIKTWIKGRKQIYYLDKIKTRTHTAIFVKDTREDSKSKRFVYNSVVHEDHRELTSADYANRFVIPSHKLLKLSKVILFKNEDLTTYKDFGTDPNSSVDVDYSKNCNFINPVGPFFSTGNNLIKDIGRTKKEIATYNNYDNVYDSNDNWGSNISKAIKVIDFNYDYTLHKGEGCLTLKSVNFKGKSNNVVLPPYSFEYENSSGGIAYDDFEKYTDSWGYYSLGCQQWSLKKIITPQGGTIEMGYETNLCKSALSTKLSFSSENNLKYNCTTPTTSGAISENQIVLDVGGVENYPISLNQQVKVDWDKQSKILNVSSQGSFGTGNIQTYGYHGTGHISEIISQRKYKVILDGNATYNSIFPTYLLGTFNPLASYKEYNKATVDIDIPSEAIYTGGGPRIKNIKVSDGVKSYETEYKYGLNENGIGYVSYIPYSQNIDKELPYSADLPAPRVMYEYAYVVPHGVNGLGNGKIRYKFNILKEKTPNQIKFGNFFELEKEEHNINNHGREVSVNHYTLKDNINSIGQLLEVATFNENNQLLSKIENNYHTNVSIPNNYGVVKESYQTYKTIIHNDPNVPEKWVVNTCTKIKYPSILSSSTESRDGYKYTTQFLDYDELSGVSKEQIMFSSDGKMLKSKIIPAFRKYPAMAQAYFESELKAKNINMLSQIAAYYNYIYQDAAWKETSVGITTWSNFWQYKDISGNDELYLTNPYTYDGNYSKEDLYKYSKQFIWRKHRTFVWNGQKDSNGIFLNYNNTNDDGFNWPSKVYGPGGFIGLSSDPINYATYYGGNENQPSQWKQTSEVTLYNHFSAPLEMKDINGNKASTKMGDNDTKIMATGNAGYNEMFYAGAENSMHNYWLEPEVRMVNAARDQTYYHTGRYSVATTSNSELGVFMRGGQHRAGRYKLSVWVKKDNELKARVRYYNNTITSTFNGESYYAGDWVLKTHYFDATTGDTYPYVNSIDGTTVYYDDLMIRPIASSITGYVYNQWDELSYIIGNNGLATHFEYDAAGRLTKTSVEVLDDAANGLTGGFKLKSENKIKYKNLP